MFLSNGEEVRCLDRETDAHPRRIAGFYSQDDLERRIAARKVRPDLSTVAIDRKIIDRDYQIECVEALSAEIRLGRRKLLVEMATGTGKTRTAAALVKHVFEAGMVTLSAEGFEVGREELDWSAMSLEVKEDFEKLFVESDRITVDPRALERKFTIPERNRAMVRRVCRTERSLDGGPGTGLRLPQW